MNDIISFLLNYLKTNLNNDYSEYDVGYFFKKINNDKTIVLTPLQLRYEAQGGGCHRLSGRLFIVFYVALGDTFANENTFDKIIEIMNYIKNKIDILDNYRIVSMNIFDSVDMPDRSGQYLSNKNFIIIKNEMEFTYSI